MRKVILRQQSSQRVWQELNFWKDERCQQQQVRKSKEGGWGKGKVPISFKKKSCCQPLTGFEMTKMSPQKLENRIRKLKPNLKSKWYKTRTKIHSSLNRNLFQKKMLHVFHKKGQNYQDVCISHESSLAILILLISCCRSQSKWIITHIIGQATAMQVQSVSGCLHAETLTLPTACDSPSETPRAAFDYCSWHTNRAGEARAADGICCLPSSRLCWLLEASRQDFSCKDFICQVN